MKNKLALACVAFGSLLATVPAMATDSDADRGRPKAVVKGSAITTSIKTKLAAEHVTSLGRIYIDTDKDGGVWMRGHARTQEVADRAAAIARETDGVSSVHSQIKVKKDW